MPWKERINSLLDLDWTKTPYIFILILSFVLSRIPLLNLGFGIDADAWRIANSAFDLRNSHVYHTSRFPGYPLPEYVNSLIIGHGWIATNSMTMILSLISVIFFARILKDLNVKNKGLLVLTYAFLPVLWINSTNTMDYMWALTFIVIAWFFVLKKQYAFAGLMMGLAIGSRITSAILIFPFLYLIWMENRRIKDCSHFIVSAVIVSFLLFLPLFLTYGFKFLTYYPGKINPILYAGYHLIECFGLLPVFFGFAVLVVSLKTIFESIFRGDKDILFLLSTIVLISILFIKAPYEAEYLIPAIPFGLLFINRICKRRELIVFLCILLLLSNSFVSFCTVKRNNEGKIVIHTIDDGMIKRNIEERTEQIDYTQSLMDVNINHSVVIIGWYLPILSYLDKKVSYSKDSKIIGDANYEKKGVWNFEKDVWYRYLVPLDELQDLQNKGYTIYYIEGMQDYTERVYDYDLNDYNCVYLDVASR